LQARKKKLGENREASLTLHGSMQAGKKKISTLENFAKPRRI
jgi:hypothetical protein